MFSPYIHISYALMSGNHQSISSTVVFPFCEYQMNAIIWYIAFWDWLLSVSIMALEDHPFLNDYLFYILFYIILFILYYF